jgi:hypothetical protein
MNASAVELGTSELSEWLAASLAATQFETGRAERLESLATSQYWALRVAAAILIAVDARYEMVRRAIARRTGKAEALGRHYKQPMHPRPPGRHFAKTDPVGTRDVIAIAGMVTVTSGSTREPATPAAMDAAALGVVAAPTVSVVPINPGAGADLLPRNAAIFSATSSDRVCDDQAWQRWEKGLATEDQDASLDELLSQVGRAERYSTAARATVERAEAWDRRVTEMSLGWVAPLPQHTVVKCLQAATVAVAGIAVALALSISSPAQHAPSARVLPPGAFGVSATP